MQCLGLGFERRGLDGSLQIGEEPELRHHLWGKANATQNLEPTDSGNNLLSGGAVNHEVSSLLWEPASARPLESTNPKPAVGDGPIIDRFEAIPDCIIPDPRRGILSYHVSNGVSRVRIDALHRGGRLRTFHIQVGSRADPARTMGATGVLDPRASTNIEAYILVATGVRGLETSRRLPFRYRLAEFDLLPPARHIRATVGSDRFARYESDAHVAHIESLTCSFRFDAPIDGEAGRAGSAVVYDPGGTHDRILRCSISWRNLRKSRAGGTVEWTARFTDPCTQGRVTRSARVNPIP